MKTHSHPEKPQGTEFFVSKKAGKAIADYQMLADGDTIAVAVSGGKDSLSLLKILNDRRSFVPITYRLVAVHIDMGYPVSHAKVLEKYFKKNGYEYHIEKIDILKKDKDAINCFWCSWNRRKALFEVADRLGITKVALGHHMDDIVETVMLNLFFQGEISAMAPKQELFKGAITLIRPFAYVEERLIKRFVKTQQFPICECVCPHSITSNRSRMGRIIKELERVNPAVKTNVFRAVKRIKAEYLL